LGQQKLSGVILVVDIMGAMMEPLSLFWAEEAQVGFVRLGFASILLLFVVIAVYFKKMRLERDYIIASLRGFFQLMLLAFVITLVFEVEYLILWLAILGLMVILASVMSAGRAKGLPNPMKITLPSIALGSGTIIAFMLVTGIMPNDRPEYIIPLGGMCIGNGMTNCSLTLNRLAGELKNNRARIESALALGATSKKAIKPFSMISMKAAMIPSIDNMKALGIIFIPGTMTGMLLAGMNPLYAAQYQVIVFFMIFSTTILTNLIAVFLAERAVFTKNHQLLESI